MPERDRTALPVGAPPRLALTPTLATEPFLQIYRFDFDPFATIENAKLHISRGRRPYVRLEGVRERGVDESALRLRHRALPRPLISARADTGRMEALVPDPAVGEAWMLTKRIVFHINGKPIRERNGRPMAGPFPSAVVVYRPPFPLAGWRAR